MHFRKISQALDVPPNFNNDRQKFDSASHLQRFGWISTYDHITEQHNRIRNRQEGTGQWFLDSPKVVRWLNEAKTTLCCPGIPGAGKTIIASIVIEHLLKITHGRSHGVAYVYCDHRKPKDQNLGFVMAAILKQLLESENRLYHKHKQGVLPPDSIFDALNSVPAIYSTVYIVIDALDECWDDHNSFSYFSLIHRIQELQREHDLRLMITTRFLPFLILKFDDAELLEIRATKEDSRDFVTNQTNIVLSFCDIKLQKLVQDTIIEAVDGIYAYV